MGSVMATFFGKIQPGPPIEVFLMNRRYLEDPSKEKVNLTVGAYRTEEGKPWVLPVVREAEKQIAADESLDHEYLPVLGHREFSRAAAELVLGSDSQALKEGRVVYAQCLSGTGALRVGADFAAKRAGFSAVYVCKPTWGNHKMVFGDAGFAAIRDYRYWDAAKKDIDEQGLLDDLEKADSQSVVVLHACAHNPTGMDPSHELWTKIAEVVKRRQLLPFFDIAYQGFASGDADADAWAVRHFVEQGIELLVAQSFAKNFDERVGNLCIVTTKKEQVAAMSSQLELLIRANFSNPPAHGARIVHKILTTPELRSKWQECITIMSGRIIRMRKELRSRLEALKTPGSWEHVTRQIGMFSYTGLTKAQVDVLVEKHKVYLLSDGRISICGLNANNVDYVARAFFDVVSNVKN